MKKFLLSLVVAVVIGSLSGWAINYQNYGRRIGSFGMFATNKVFSAADLVSELPVDRGDSQAKVEMLTPQNHDFGMMKPGDEGTHTFIVKNTGTEDLRLRLGATTCKCTLGELKREALAPGETTEVTLTWTVEGSGEPEFRQSAQILTNDPTKVAISLEIMGRIVENVDVVPETWSFGEVATGEPLEITGTIYNFMDDKILPGEASFSSEELTALSTFEVEPYEPTEELDGIRSTATEAFKVTIKVLPGMRQGAVSQNFLLPFQRLDGDGNVIPAPAESIEHGGEMISVTTAGKIVGNLGMIGPRSKLDGIPGGGYLYSFGRIGKGGSLKCRVHVTLRGDDRKNTKLKIRDKVVPEGVVKATLGDAKDRATMTLYPLEIELVPGKEPIQRLGTTKDDYGSIWIESDNPKVTPMRIAIKFAIEGE